MVRKYTSPPDPNATPGEANFWIVVSFPKENYSEQLEWHEEVPMLVPASGTGNLKGIAKNRDDLNVMVTDEDHIHLTYKIKVRGRNLVELLEFLAKHDMVEKET